MGRSHVRTRRDADPAGYGYDLETVEQPFDPRRLFDRAPGEAPLEVEIGSGKGSFLVAESELRPDTLFLGVERARRYWLYAADRLRRRERPNARIVRGDAREVLEAMPEGIGLRTSHVFPGPLAETEARAPPPADPTGVSRRLRSVCWPPGLRSGS